MKLCLNQCHFLRLEWGMSEARAYDGFHAFAETPHSPARNWIFYQFTWIIFQESFSLLSMRHHVTWTWNTLGAQQRSLFCLRAYSHQWMALMFTIHEFCEMRKNNNNEQRREKKRTHTPQKPSEIWPKTRNCFCKRRKNHSAKEYNVRIYEAWKCNIKSFLASLDTGHKHNFCSV